MEEGVVAVVLHAFSALLRMVCAGYDPPGWQGGEACPVVSGGGAVSLGQILLAQGGQE